MNNKDGLPEIMINAMAAEIKDGNTALHGISSPMPILAMGLAARTHAPNMYFISGAGSVDPQIERLYLCSFDPRQNAGATSYFGLHEAFDLAQQGRLDVMYLGAAQIDRHGNTNLSVIGGGDGPKIQLPGGAASAFLVPITPQVVIWTTRHSTRTFVDEVDFVTGQGYNNRAEDQMENEMTIVTNLGVMNFKNADRLMQIQSYHPGHSIDEIQENTGFEILVAQDVCETPQPATESLAHIRQMDSDNIRLSEFGK